MVGLAGTIASCSANTPVSPANSVPPTASSAVSLGTPSPTGPGVVEVQTASSYRFDSPAEMAATSDLVVEGQVVGATPGPTVGTVSADNDMWVVKRHVEVQVLETFRGKAPAKLIVAEDGTDAKGRQFVTDGLPELAIGQRVILFLFHVPASYGANVYARISTAGEFIVQDDGSVRTGKTEEGAVTALRALTPDRLRQAVRDASALVVTEKIPPRKPGDVSGSTSPSTTSPSVGSPTK